MSIYSDNVSIESNLPYHLWNMISISVLNLPVSFVAKKSAGKFETIVSGLAYWINSKTHTHKRL